MGLGIGSGTRILAAQSRVAIARREPIPGAPSTKPPTRGRGRSPASGPSRGSLLSARSPGQPDGGYGGLMIPLFNAQAVLVGWLQDLTHLWDARMEWVAWINDGHVFSAATHGWCGPLNGTSGLDRQGRVVAWNPGQGPQGTLPPLQPLAPLSPLTPLRPLQPLTPLTPLAPLTPLSGWSFLSFEEWVSGR